MADLAPDAAATATEQGHLPARRPVAARYALHAAAVVAPAVPLAATAGDELARGWRPTSDDAALAWRAFDVFSAHAPLLGAYNDASASPAHPVFDLGPLEYYLLAVPVRIDPVHGLLWGAVLLAGLLAGVAVHAAWRAGGPAVAAVVSGGFLLLAATQVTAVLNLPWNPNLGCYAFACCLVTAAAAASGRLAWWPVAVGAGALAADCHLVFAACSVAAVAAGLVTGLVARRRDRAGRVALPLVSGLGVGLAALAPTLVQQVADRRGNLSALVSGLGHHGRPRGLASGFAALGRAASWPPAWTHAVPAVGTFDRDARFLTALFGGSDLAGIALTAVAGLVAAVSLATRRWGLGGAAVVATVSAVALAWTYGSVAASQTATLTYVDVASWPVAMALDGVVAAGAVALVAGLARRPPAGHRAGPGSLRARVLAGSLAAVALSALLGWALVADLSSTGHSDAVIGGWEVARSIDPVAAAVARRVGHAEVVVEPGDALFEGGLPTWALAEGVVYALHAEGVDVRTLPPTAPELGEDAVPAGRETTFLVLPDGHGRWRIAEVARPRPMALLALVRWR